MYYYQLMFRPNFRDKNFYEGNTFIFKSDLELEKGDYVVATTKFGYQIGVVYDKNENVVGNYSMPIQKIVTKLDGNYYEEKEKKEKIKSIEKILNEKSKNISKIMQFETLAKYDNEAKELLEEYKNLQNSNFICLPQISEDTEEYEEECPF